jgi:hypothetical protein
MTTRPKTHKAPTAKPAMHETFGSLLYDASTASIPKLIARLRFLEDCAFWKLIAGIVRRSLPRNGRNALLRLTTVKSAPRLCNDSPALSRTVLKTPKNFWTSPFRWRSPRTPLTVGTHQ